MPMPRAASAVPTSPHVQADELLPWRPVGVAGLAAPLLRAADLRVDVDGAPAIEGAAFETRGTRVVLLGAHEALARCAAGLTEPARGQLAVLGVPAADALRTGSSAYVPRDPPLPLAWTVERYVATSARLAGRPAHPERARAVVAPLALERALGLPIRELSIGARRAVALAAALAAEPGVVLLEDPTLGLAEDEGHRLGAACVAALGQRPWACFAGRISLASPLARAAQEALLFVGGEVVGQGPPGRVATADGAFALRVHGDRRALVRALEAHGAEADLLAAHVVVRLPAGQSTVDVFARALETGCAILELRSLARSFS